MKHLMFLLLILLFDVSVAQDIKILKKEFSQSSSNQHRAEMASELSWSFKDQNPDSSLFYAELALTYSRLAKDHKIEAFSLSDIGNYYKRLENYKKAHGYYIKSLHLRKSFGNIEDISSAYNQLGLLYRQWEKYDSAAYYFSEGLNRLPRNQHIKMRMKLLDGLGMTLFHMGDYKMAMYKVDASRRLSEELKDSLSIAESWQNTGTINQYIGNASLALSNYKKAGIYYRTLGNLNGEIEVEINRAAIYFIQGKYNQAESLLLNAKSKSETLNFLGERSTIYLNLAKLYDITRPSKAFYYYEMAYKYASQKGKDATRIDAAIGLVNHLIKFNGIIP